MTKEFTDNVQRLFNETVKTTSKREQSNSLELPCDNKQNKVKDQLVQSHQSATDLLAVLRSKVTQPLQVITFDACKRVIYYNVSVTLENNLSSMTIAYNSDYQMTFHDISHCDLHQLSEFILALECDIPKWRHIWVADEKLRKEKNKIGDRLKSSMRQFRSDWMSSWTRNEENMVKRFRIKYYNLQACKMCLDNDNPFWQDKYTEAEILEECYTLHMDPPMEQWFTDFTNFIDECRQQRDERDRQWEELKRAEEKIPHLIRIKQLKLEAIIKSVEFHEGFSVSVESHQPQELINFFGRLAKHSMDGYFLMHFNINGASTVCRIYFNDLDRCTPAIKNAITCINDMIPELTKMFNDESLSYYLMGNDQLVGQELDYESGMPFTVVRYSCKKKRVTCCTQLQSNIVVRKINEIIQELNNITINNDKNETNDDK